MMDKGDLAQRLLRTFLVEAEERLENLEKTLALLRGPNPAPELVETVYREAHSLKGAARAANLRTLERLCQSLESMLSPLRQRSTLDLEILSLMDSTCASLKEIVISTKEQRTVDPAAYAELVASLEAPRRPTQGPPAHTQRPQQESSSSFARNPEPPKPTRPEGHGSSPEVLRMPIERLTDLMRDAEELILVHQGSGERVNGLIDLDNLLAERASVHRQVALLERSFESNLP